MIDTLKGSVIEYSHVKLQYDVYTTYELEDEVPNLKVKIFDGTLWLYKLSEDMIDISRFKRKITEWYFWDTPTVMKICDAGINIFLDNGRNRCIHVLCENEDDAIKLKLLGLI